MTEFNLNTFNDVVGNLIEVIKIKFQNTSDAKEFHDIEIYIQECINFILNETIDAPSFKESNHVNFFLENLQLFFEENSLSRTDFYLKTIALLTNNRNYINQSVENWIKLFYAKAYEELEYSKVTQFVKPDLLALFKNSLFFRDIPFSINAQKTNFSFYIVSNLENDKFRQEIFSCLKDDIDHCGYWKDLISHIPVDFKYEIFKLSDVYFENTLNNYFLFDDDANFIKLLISIDQEYYITDIKNRLNKFHKRQKDFCMKTLWLVYYEAIKLYNANYLNELDEIIEYYLQNSKKTIERFQFSELFRFDIKTFDNTSIFEQYCELYLQRSEFAKLFELSNRILEYENIDFGSFVKLVPKIFYSNWVDIFLYCFYPRFDYIREQKKEAVEIVVQGYAEHAYKQHYENVFNVMSKYDLSDYYVKFVLLGLELKDFIIIEKYCKMLLKYKITLECQTEINQLKMPNLLKNKFWIYFNVQLNNVEVIEGVEYIFDNEKNDLERNILLECYSKSNIYIPQEVNHIINKSLLRKKLKTRFKFSNDLVNYLIQSNISIDAVSFLFYRLEINDNPNDYEYVQVINSFSESEKRELVEFLLVDLKIKKWSVKEKSVFILLNSLSSHLAEKNDIYKELIMNLVVYKKEISLKEVLNLFLTLENVELLFLVRLFCTYSSLNGHIKKILDDFVLDLLSKQNIELNKIDYIFMGASSNYSIQQKVFNEIDSINELYNVELASIFENYLYSYILKRLNSIFLNDIGWSKEEWILMVNSGPFIMNIFKDIFWAEFDCNDKLVNLVDIDNYVDIGVENYSSNTLIKIIYPAYLEDFQLNTIKSEEKTLLIHQLDRKKFLKKLNEMENCFSLYFSGRKIVKPLKSISNGMNKYWSNSSLTSYRFEIDGLPYFADVIISDTKSKSILYVEFYSKDYTRTLIKKVPLIFYNELFNCLDSISK